MARQLDLEDRNWLSVARLRLEKKGQLGLNSTRAATHIHMHGSDENLAGCGSLKARLERTDANRADGFVWRSTTTVVDGSLTVAARQNDAAEDNWLRRLTSNWQRSSWRRSAATADDGWDETKIGTTTNWRRWPTTGKNVAACMARLSFDIGRRRVRRNAKESVDERMAICSKLLVMIDEQIGQWRDETSGRQLEFPLWG